MGWLMGPVQISGQPRHHTSTSLRAQPAAAKYKDGARVSWCKTQRSATTSASATTTITPLPTQTNTTIQLAIQRLLDAPLLVASML